MQRIRRNTQAHIALKGRELFIEGSRKQVEDALTEINIAMASPNTTGDDPRLKLLLRGLPEDVKPTDYHQQFAKMDYVDQGYVKTRGRGWHEQGVVSECVGVCLHTQTLCVCVCLCVCSFLNRGDDVCV